MIHILTTSFNASNYLHLCIKSLQAQTVKDWKCHITDDGSTDGSISLIESLIENDKRFILYKNEVHFWQVGNYWQIHQLNEIKDSDIMITVDLDDWLYDPNVFQRISETYKDNKTWVTYGSFMSWYGTDKPLGPGISQLHPDIDNCRITNWLTSHLRTWKAGIFRKIKKEDLMCPWTNWFWDAAGDLAFMFPMCEMASKDHSKFLSEINYIYNNANPLSEGKIMIDKVQKNDRYIRSMPKYQRIII